MANNIDPMVAVLVAETGFRAFNTKLTSLLPFSTNFSSELASEGDEVKTSITPVSADAVDLKNDAAGDRWASNVIEDISETEVKVTLNKTPIKGFALTDFEVASMRRGVMSRVVRNTIVQKANAVARSVQAEVWNLITAANYGTAILNEPPSSFEGDDLFDISGELKQDFNWDMDEESFAVLQPNYVTALQKDNAIQDLSASGMPVMMDGSQAIVKRRVGDFTIIEAASLPPSSGTVFDEKLRGFVSKPPAIALAMRAVRGQAEEDYLAFEVLTDEETGITMVMRVGHDRALGKVFWTFETLFGAVKAQTEALKRITDV